MIVKRNIPFPFVGPVGITGISVPGTSFKYSTGSRFGSSTVAVSPDPGAISLATAAQKVSLPRDPRGSDNAKLRAITLAPDSAYSMCDIWTKIDGSVEAYRCDIQNPVMGIDIADQADIYVTVPNLIPAIAVAANDQYWDANVLTDGANPGGLWCAPLRLYFWYDEIPMSAPTARPMLHARGRVQNPAATTTNFYVPVEGRKAFMLRINFGTANAQAEIFQWYGRGSNTQPQIEGAVRGTAVIALPFSENSDIPVTSPPVAVVGAENGIWTILNKALVPGCPLLQIQHVTAATPDAAAGVTFDLYAYDTL